MTVKTYRVWTLIIVIIVAGLAGWGVAVGNAFIPAPAVIAGSIILLILKRMVKEVTTDERTFRVAGRAARFTVNIFVILAAMAGATLLALGSADSPAVETVGFTLAYSICALLILYYIGYIYYNRKFGGTE
jgi:uncharacterized membrane protein